MNTLKDLFQNKNLDKVRETYFKENTSICYYPSSGYDFRHIFFWDNYCEQNNIEFPEIFIHSDFSCLDWNPFPKNYMGSSRFFYERMEKEGKKIPHPLLYNGYILDVFGNSNSLVIQKWTELFLKNDIYYPNRDLYYYPEQIKENTHKVFAIECQLINLERDLYSLTKGSPIQSIGGNYYTLIDPKDKHNHNKIRVSDSEGRESNSDYNSYIYPSSKKLIILLFTIENSNFFYDVLLENKIKIDFLTHLNDGGASMGDSRKKMDFIYLYTETLGIKNMILDDRINEKYQHIKEWEYHLYKNPKVNRKESLQKKTELILEDWIESKKYFPDSTGIYIKGKWDSGHQNWKYSDFDNPKLEPTERHLRKRANGQYIDEYYHFRKKIKQTRNFNK